MAKRRKPDEEEGGVAVADKPKSDQGEEKPRRGRKQAEFEGNGFPGPPPEEVCDARDTYLSSMRAHAKAAEKKAKSEQSLIEAMHKHEIKRVKLDGENKYFEIEAPEKIKTKTVPKEQREEREGREHATAG